MSGHAGDSDNARNAMRLDAWLWMSRFYKTRALAADYCAAGKVRIDGRVVEKAHAAVRPGMVITLPQGGPGGRIRVVRVLGLPIRRGPASDAARWWEDLDAPPEAPR